MHIETTALTFDDVLLLPAYSEALPRDVDLKTRLTRDIVLNIPLLSAAMDTVTESRLAIALAQEGGIGIVHKNLSPTRQAQEVIRVKRYEAGVLRDPLTVTPQMTVNEVLALAKQHGFSGFPVLQNKKVVGIITNRDVRFEKRVDAKVADVMTKREQLVTVDESASLDHAKDLLHRHRLERVLVIDKDDGLRGIITVKDIQKTTEFPNACRDVLGQLRVGAAVGVAADIDERVEKLVAAGVDVIVIDTAHGHSKGVIETVKRIKNGYPKLALIAGNIATTQAAEMLAKAGVDGVKVGIGPGSICTTRIVAGVGVPQITAIAKVTEVLKNSDVPIIADGGIRYSGDIAKAIAAGSDSVMVGSLLAGTDEAPGDIILFQGRSYKTYRGMGSIEAMKEGAADRYGQDVQQSRDKLVPEGIEGRVPYKGSVTNIIHQLIGGVRSSMGYCGVATIHALKTQAKFVQITAAGVKESHVHDVQITKEAPNYRSELINSKY